MLGKEGPLGPLNGSLGGGLSIGPFGGGPSNCLLRRGYHKDIPRLFGIHYDAQFLP